MDCMLLNSKGHMSSSPTKPFTTLLSAPWAASEQKNRFPASWASSQGVTHHLLFLWFIHFYKWLYGCFCTHAWGRKQPPASIVGNLESSPARPMSPGSSDFPSLPSVGMWGRTEVMTEGCREDSADSLVIIERVSGLKCGQLLVLIICPPFWTPSF